MFCCYFQNVCAAVYCSYMCHDVLNLGCKLDLAGMLLCLLLNYFCIAYAFSRWYESTFISVLHDIKVSLSVFRM